MATRRKAQETPVEFDFSTVTAAPAAAPVIAFKPNPLKNIVQQSIDNGYQPLEITVPDSAVKEACNMLRRAALPVDKGGLDCGMRIVTRENNDGTTVISFQTKAEKKTRNYTAEDVRAWAKTQPEIPKELYGTRVHRDVSRAYRIAHGLETVKDA